MAEFNIQKVFRQVRNELKKEYFDSRAPELSIDWKRVGERNITVLFDAFKSLPDEKRNLITREMNDLFDISVNKNSGPVIHSLINLFGLTPPKDFDDWTVPDQSMWMLLNSDDEVKKRIFQYTEIDSISARYWLVQKLRADGASGKTACDAQHMTALREAISGFVFRHTGHGKQCIIDFIERDDAGEECFFVYYNKPQRIIPQWHDEQFSWDVDHASSEMVFVYNRERNELRIRAKAFDREKRSTLCQIWARAMRDTSLDDSCFVKKLYDIDEFIYRAKARLPDELLDVFSVFEVSFADVDFDGSGKQRMTLNHRDGDVYDRLDTMFSGSDAARSVAVMRKIKFRVRLNPRYKFNRDVVVYFSGDHTDLYSKNEAIRSTLIDAFKTLGVIREFEERPETREIAAMKTQVEHEAAEQRIAVAI